jgi:translation initiation factor IF-1
MAERPPIRTKGRITRTHQKNRLYEVEMANGYRAYAIIEKKGPACSMEDPTGQEVVVDFSPYDMSKCKVVEWAR